MTNEQKKKLERELSDLHNLLIKVSNGDLSEEDEEWLENPDIYDLYHSQRAMLINVLDILGYSVMGNSIVEK